MLPVSLQTEGGSQKSGHAWTSRFRISNVSTTFLPANFSRRTLLERSEEATRQEKREKER